MHRPQLLRRRGNFWSDPWDGREISEPPYSPFILWLTRVSAFLLVFAVGVMVAGILRDSEKLVWGSLALVVPALMYLLLVYSWAWARAALDEINYGIVAAVEEETAETKTHETRPTPKRGALAWWQKWRHSRKQPKTSDRALLWRLAKECRRYWLHLTAVLLVSLAATPIFLLSPLPLKIAVDSVLKDRPLPPMIGENLPGFFTSSGFWLLMVAAILQVTVALMSQIQSLVSNLLSTYAGEKMSLDLRTRMFSHVQRLSLAFHDTKGATDSAYRVQYDSPSIQAMTIGGFVPIITSSVTLVSAFIVALRIDWQLCVVALAAAPLLFMSSQRFKNQMRPHYTGVKELESSALGVAQEVLTSLRVVKAFGREDSESERFAEVSRLGVRAKVRLALAEGVFGMIASTTVSIGAAAVLFLGVRHVQTGVITLGELLMVMGYTAQLFKPLKTFTKQVGRMQNSLASAARAFELLDEEPEATDRPHALPLAHGLGEIAFENVRFSYTDGQPTIEGATFHIDPGSTVGIAGRTGAGKSTLLSLMMRFYEPGSGTIRFDGRDIRDYKLVDLRSQFALVLQEPVLFSTTIAENIRYGRPDATMDEVVAAAVAANAHTFIENIPGGYDSLVGERGMKLSGGERQRISLARAFLKNASVLVLDEPTSSVDVQTEAEIMEALHRLMEGRTTLMIAHRLKTLETCDRILFVR
ncbi:MAG TPA: ABC transporter ATP-binding protein, partial [Actinomycetota bacterium]|nr:ABC transporter ATP-binding protein [Actinomycetota bacterium]